MPFVRAEPLLLGNAYGGVRLHLRTERQRAGRQADGDDAGDRQYDTVVALLYRVVSTPVIGHSHALAFSGIVPHHG